MDSTEMIELPLGMIDQNEIWKAFACIAEYHQRIMHLQWLFSEWIITDANTLAEIVQAYKERFLVQFNPPLH